MLRNTTGKKGRKRPHVEYACSYVLKGAGIIAITSLCVHGFVNGVVLTSS